jgi:hypothetical protein
MLHCNNTQLLYTAFIGHRLPKKYANVMTAHTFVYEMSEHHLYTGHSVKSSDKISGIG